MMRLGLVFFLTAVVALAAGHAQASTPLQQLTSDPGTDVRPAWSPDGQQVAFQSNRSGSYGIWLTDADGANQREVMPGDSDDRRPSWSPDGTQLAFDSDVSGAREIWIVDSDGQNPRQLTSLEALSNFATWSPDGTRIAFYVYQDGRLNLWSVSVDGNDAQQLTSELADERRGQCTFACHRVDWSPDGEQIVYTGGDHKSIWTMNADGTNPTEVAPSADRNHFPWYTRDGRIGYLTEHVTTKESWTDAWVIDPESGEQTLLVDHIQHQGPLSWSPDETKVLFHSPRSGNFDIYSVDLTVEGGREVLQATPESTNRAAEAPDFSHEMPDQDTGPDATEPDAAEDAPADDVGDPDTPADAEQLPPASDDQAGAWYESPLLLGSALGLITLILMIGLGVVLYIARGGRRV